MAGVEGAPEAGGAVAAPEVNPKTMAKDIQAHAVDLGLGDQLDLSSLHPEHLLTVHAFSGDLHAGLPDHFVENIAARQGEALASLGPEPEKPNMLDHLLAFLRMPGRRDAKLTAGKSYEASVKAINDIGGGHKGKVLKADAESAAEDAHADDLLAGLRAAVGPGGGGGALSPSERVTHATPTVSRETHEATLKSRYGGFSFDEVRAGMDALKKIIANEGPMSHEYVDAGAPENQFVTEGMTPKQASKQLEEMQAYMEVVDQEREALHGDARDDLAKLARDTQ